MEHFFKHAKTIQWSNLTYGCPSVMVSTLDTNRCLLTRHRQYTSDYQRSLRSFSKYFKDTDVKKDTLTYVKLWLPVKVYVIEHMCSIMCAFSLCSNTNSLARLWICKLTLFCGGGIDNKHDTGYIFKCQTANLPWVRDRQHGNVNQWHHSCKSLGKPHTKASISGHYCAITVLGILSRTSDLAPSQIWGRGSNINLFWHFPKSLSLSLFLSPGSSSYVDTKRLQNSI